jgi:lanosterol synthase
MVATRSNGALKATPNAKKRVSHGNIDPDAKRLRIANKTDRTRWRLLDESGRLTWHYLEDDDAVKKWPQSIADKWYLGLNTVSIDNYSSSSHMISR